MTASCVSGRGGGEASAQNKKIVVGICLDETGRMFTFQLKNLQEKFSSSNIKNCRFIASDLSGLLLKNNNFDSYDI